MTISWSSGLINCYQCLDVLLHVTFVRVLHVTSSQHSQVKESSQALPVQVEVGMEEGDGELPVRYERDLVQKLKVLRHELSLQQPQAGHCRIEVSREEIFEVLAVSRLNNASHVVHA